LHKKYCEGSAPILIRLEISIQENVKICFSFWETFSPGPPLGLFLWTPLGDFCPRGPVARPP